jgi:hypothetical protein
LLHSLSYLNAFTWSTLVSTPNSVVWACGMTGVLTIDYLMTILH